MILADSKIPLFMCVRISESMSQWGVDCDYPEPYTYRRCPYSEYESEDKTRMYCPQSGEYKRGCAECLNKQRQIDAIKDTVGYLQTTLKNIKGE